MAFVWSVMLSFDNDEWWEEGEDEPRDTCEPLERINEWIPHGKLVDLTEPTYAKGAGYGMDVNLYGGGFKHFDIEGFIEVVRAQDWKARSQVQLWVRGAVADMGEEPFTLIRLGRRRSSRPKPRAKPTARSKAAVKTKGKTRRG